MNRITLWINIRADDRTAEMSAIASNAYHSTNKTFDRDRIFKLTPIHDPVIYQIPRIRFELYYTLTKWYTSYF